MREARAVRGARGRRTGRRAKGRATPRPPPGSSGVRATATRARRTALVVAGTLGATIAGCAVRPAVSLAASPQRVAAGAVPGELAVGDDGRAFLVTTERAGVAGGGGAVRLRTAAPAAGFGPARTLMRRGPGVRGMRAGVAADGTGVIALQTEHGTRREVRAAAFGARGRVGRPVTISLGGADDLAALDVAPSGAAAVVWFRHGRRGRWRLEAAVREPGATRFGPPHPLSRFVQRPCCTSVSLAVGERGDTAVTWTSTSRPVVWAALRSAGRAFRSPQTLATDGSDAPRVAVGAGGNAAVIYSVQHVPARPDDGLQLHRAAPGAPFGHAEHVDPGRGVTIGAASVTPAGRVLVAWTDPARATVHLSEAAPTGPLVNTGELGASVTAGALSVAGDDDGRAVVAWPRLVSTAPAVREQAMAATRPADGAPFGPAIPLGRPWREARPALAGIVADGGALVAWTGARGGAAARRRVTLEVTRLP